MATTVHKNLTGADLHEPKGADTATSGKVYVSNGAGSGVWTDASSIITNTAFTTGDLKLTHKVAADTSWILWSDGTIGDGSSSSTIRANADTATLFALYWNNYSNTLCPIYTSAGSVSTRGVSAAADFAAHKRLAVPLGAGRALGLAGSGSGLTARTLGSVIGNETATLSTTNLPPYTPQINFSGAVLFTNSTLTWNQAAGSSRYDVSTAAGITGTGVPQGGNSTPFSIMDPTSYVNIMIKL